MGLSTDRGSETAVFGPSCLKLSRHSGVHTSTPAKFHPSRLHFTNHAEHDTFLAIASCVEQGGQDDEVCHDHRVAYRALGAVVLAKPTPVERVGLAMSAVLTTGTAS